MKRRRQHPGTALLTTEQIAAAGTGPAGDDVPVMAR